MVRFRVSAFKCGITLPLLHPRTAGNTTLQTLETASAPAEPPISTTRTYPSLKRTLPQNGGHLVHLVCLGDPTLCPSAHPNISWRALVGGRPCHVGDRLPGCRKTSVTRTLGRCAHGPLSVYKYPGFEDNVSSHPPSSIPSLPSSPLLHVSPTVAIDSRSLSPLHAPVIRALSHPTGQWVSAQ